jgi:hypothetical protein
VVEKLRRSAPRHSADGEFVGVDLRGTNLSGGSLTLVSLAHARLDGADLTQAQVTLVDLRGASLRDAHLERARLDLVDAGSAVFTGAFALESLLAQSNLTGADFSNAGLERVVVRGCALQSAPLDGVDLSHGMLVACGADGPVSVERTYRRPTRSARALTALTSRALDGSSCAARSSSRFSGGTSATTRSAPRSSAPWRCSPSGATPSRSNTGKPGPPIGIWHWRSSGSTPSPLQRGAARGVAPAVAGLAGYGESRRASGHRR